jgi:hypothetical protein
MIAFFFTMPMSRMIPIKRDDAELAAADQQGENRPDTGGRERRQNRDRMNVALVEHAEDDVDRDDRGEDQPRLVL